jgi:hypothetical protein
MSNSPQPKTWRDALLIHPAAELFPLMSEPELARTGRGHQEKRASVTHRCL